MAKKRVVKEDKIGVLNPINRYKEYTSSDSILLSSMVLSNMGGKYFKKK